MKSIARFVGLTIIATAASTSHAALLDYSGSIAGSNQAGSVDYYSFDVDASSSVRVETFTDSFDSYLWLFNDDGNLDTLDALAFDDDSGAENSAGSGFSNSRVNVDLEPGSYITAVGDFVLTLDEAVAGVNDSSSLGDFAGPYRLEVDGLGVVDPLAMNGSGTPNGGDGGNSNGGDMNGDGINGDGMNGDGMNGDGMNGDGMNGDGMNGDGMTDGSMTDGGDKYDDGAVNVSEPLSASLFAMGLIAFGAMRQRSKRR